MQCVITRYKCCSVQVIVFPFMHVKCSWRCLVAFVRDTQPNDWLAGFEVVTETWNPQVSWSAWKKKRRSLSLFSAELSRFLCGHLGSRLMPSGSQVFRSMPSRYNCSTFVFVGSEVLQWYELRNPPIGSMYLKPYTTSIGIAKVFWLWGHLLAQKRTNIWHFLSHHTCPQGWWRQHCA